MQPQTKKRFIHRALTSRGVIIIEAILIIVIGIGITKEIVRRVSLRREITTLEGQITQLQAQNKSLGDYVASINTSSYQEREARKRLNLQKPGETLLILPEQDTTSDSVVTTSSSSTVTSNPQRWWTYLFRPRT